MMTLIIALGTLLILLILYMLFRIGSLTKLVGKQKPDDFSGNAVHGFLFMAFAVLGMAAMAWYSYTRFDEYTLPLSSEHGAEIDQLFWITMVLTLAAAVPILLALFGFAWKYRYNPKRKAFYFTDNTTLEVIWTIIPAVVLTLLISRGLVVWNDITGAPDENAEVIEVVGQQFAWTIRYPGVKDNQLGEVNYKLIDAVNEFGLDLTDHHTHDDFKSLELHLPKGREVLLQIRAKDVLHSVFLPHFRVKMDAIPGMLTTFKFTATKSTEEMRDELDDPNFNYELACTELCGTGHFSMRTLVVVQEEEDYEKWKKEQKPWLYNNPDYMVRVPTNLRDMAMSKSGLMDAAVEANTIKPLQAR